jgi:LytS/YehU family sensor histidine kinase
LVFGITLLIYFFIRFRESALKKREAINREKLMFQFQTLRSQVNPHFLFNSFSTLISVIDEDKEIAIEYVEKLSLFFRNILEYRDKDLIPLNEELKLIETYFYLQKKRYCDNLQLTVEINEKTLTSLIPPMVLQMLVENAIKHSIISAEKPLTVEIIADEKYITITNNLQRKKDKEPSTGIGLTNIRNRYALLGFGEIGIDAANDRFIVQLPIIYTEK